MAARVTASRPTRPRGFAARLALLLQRRFALSYSPVGLSGHAYEFASMPRRGVEWLHWPCGQNSGLRPEGRRRVLKTREANEPRQTAFDSRGQQLVEAAGRAMIGPRLLFGGRPRSSRNQGHRRVRPGASPAPAAPASDYSSPRPEGRWRADEASAARQRPGPSGVHSSRPPAARSQSRQQPAPSRRREET